MKKPLLIISIVALILITSFVKNSTKKIEDKIFILNANIICVIIVLETIKNQYFV